MEVGSLDLQTTALPKLIKLPFFASCVIVHPIQFSWQYVRVRALIDIIYQLFICQHAVSTIHTDFFNTHVSHELLDLLLLVMLPDILRKHIADLMH